MHKLSTVSFSNGAKELAWSLDAKPSKNSYPTQTAYASWIPLPLKQEPEAEGLTAGFRLVLLHLRSSVCMAKRHICTNCLLVHKFERAKELA
jgi:hypothetical protein